MPFVSVKTCLLVTITLFYTVTAQAQSKQKAEKEFVQFLDEVLQTSMQHPHYEDVTMQVDSSFAISPSGMLSLTIRYTNDTSSIMVRTVAPLRKMVGVVQDVYLSLRFSDNAVSTFSKEKNNWSEPLQETLFFIGNIQDDAAITAKAEKLWKKLKKYYPVTGAQP